MKLQHTSQHPLAVQSNVASYAVFIGGTLRGPVPALIVLNNAELAGAATHLIIPQ